MSLEPEVDRYATIESLLRKLTLAEKVDLLTGQDFWSTHAMPSIGLRSMRLSDGPCGVRGVVWDERQPSLNLPSATALAASWDPLLAHDYGTAMAAEARAKGIDVVLGPTINLHRSPLGGRHFEAYSEDPLLTGVIGCGFVRGIQRYGVGACPKHYVANDAETDRFTVNIEAGPRTLHELYLAPFEDCVRAGAWCIMSAYNSVGGTTMTQNDLLWTPLKTDWGFDGVVVSDWMAVRSLESARAGQDLVMPGPEGPWGHDLIDAVEAGDIRVEVVEDKVRRLLLLASRVGALEAFPTDYSTPNIPGGGPAMARRAEIAGMVLLRNEPAGGQPPSATAGGLLPLIDVESVAVIGQSAELPRTQGGGSATVVPAEVISPLAGLRAALPEATIDFQIGAVPQEGLRPLSLAELANPYTGEPGVSLRLLNADGEELLREDRQATQLVWMGNAPSAATSAILRTRYTPSYGGPAKLGVSAVGHSELAVDGITILDVDQEPVGTDLGAAILAPPMAAADIDLEAGRSYDVTLTYRLPAQVDMPGGGVMNFTLGWQPIYPPADELIAQAAEAAASAQVAIVVVGTTAEVESEGFDRTSLALPGRQDDLVRAVAAANPLTVVVVNSGAPVLMPWREDVAAIVLGWFGGQEFGSALAEVLTGASEPGGRLPTTWPAEHEDVPVIDVTPDEDGVLRYREGIEIGYRAWAAGETQPAFPFGSGFGYTTFEWHTLVLTPSPDGVEAQVTVRNTGNREGSEVVQIYLSAPEGEIARPPRWLAGFAKIVVPAGATANAIVHLPASAFAYWDCDAAQWRDQQGEFTVHAARNAVEDVLTALVER